MFHSHCRRSAMIVANTQEGVTTGAVYDEETGSSHQSSSFVVRRSRVQSPVWDTCKVIERMAFDDLQSLDSFLLWSMVWNEAESMIACESSLWAKSQLFPRTELSKHLWPLDGIEKRTSAKEWDGKAAYDYVFDGLLMFSQVDLINRSLYSMYQESRFWDPG